MMAGERVGVIGGTGLYSLEGIEVIAKREVSTPFGRPSAPLTIGRLGSQEVVFLPRHGENHEWLPSEINYRANLWALKQEGAHRVVSVSATGSLVREIGPGDLVLVSQYLDWTRGRRAATYFGEGMIAHISTAEPACPALSGVLSDAAAAVGVPLHRDRIYACVEGPRLGTRAESFFLKGAGCHLVGMTNVPEAFLAREAQLCYVTLAVATDYDCWLDDPSEHVTAEQVMVRYKGSLGRVRRVLEAYLRRAPSDGVLARSPARKGLQGAVVTPDSALSDEKRKILDFLRV